MSITIAKVRDLRKHKSTIQPNPSPATPDGKKRCHKCDQVFALKKSSCPHCKAEYTVPLSDIDTAVSEEEAWVIFENDVKRLRPKVHMQESRAELVDLMFQRAMAVRYSQPRRSLDLFTEVVAFDPKNWEARIKISWLLIRFNEFNSLIPIVEPITRPDSDATVEQKQRAFNNMVCSYMFRLPMDMVNAEKCAREGIALSKTGSVKLWENLGSTLKHQGRLAEARDAFNFALTIDPNSEFATANLHNLNVAEKQRKKSKPVSSDKENSQNSHRLVKLFSSKSFKKSKSKSVDRI